MNSSPIRSMFDEISLAADLGAGSFERVSFSGSERLPSCFPVSEIAAATIGTACLAISDLAGVSGAAPSVAVDYRLASLWFGTSIRPQGWKIPDPWDQIAGDYPAQDGWIKLHTNAPHHKAAALKVLGARASRDEVAKAVARWQGDELEQAIVAAGGCAAKLRDHAEWLAHPQGRAVSQEPLLRCSVENSAVRSDWSPRTDRPLAGLRVLDLTRIIAGPVATRFLAGFGASVLRIDPIDWEEPAVAPEVTLGKRCARLDLHTPSDRQLFEELLSKADVIVHGYRADALERLGYGVEQRQTFRPGLIDVWLNAYGHTGPWALRRGFDSLVQFSTGIAAEGMAWRNAKAPVSLPVQALDHATGYLMAPAAIRGVIARQRGEGAIRFQLSLARTAELLFAHIGVDDQVDFHAIDDGDYAEDAEKTSWGPARRVNAPASISDVPMGWELPASALGSHEAAWPL